MQPTKQGDMSSIRGNIFSTIQARLRGSTGPPELPNRLKTSPYPCTWHEGPPNSLLTKNQAERAQSTVGRPCVGGPRAPLTLILHVASCGWSSMVVWPNPRVNGWWIPPIYMRGGAPNEHNTHQHLSHFFSSLGA